MASIRYYFSEQQKIARFINVWDVFALVVILGVFALLAWGAAQMTTPYHLGEPTRISLDPAMLPNYALRSVLRMGIALMFSLLFTFVVGTWAAKNKTAEKFLIPLIDVFQSIPVLGFQSISVVPFIILFSGSMFGLECSSIFVIFTAQVWNMTLGFYQTVKTVPHELHEAADMYHLSAWQRFWRVEVPFSMQGLLWNTMMSMSAAWFFVVASEAISVSNQNIKLPGIGSYIDVAIRQADLHAVAYAIAAMLIVILIYDQLLFRPLLKWSEKFSFDDVPSERTMNSWFLQLLQKTHLLQQIGSGIGNLANTFINAKWLLQARKRPDLSARKPRSKLQSQLITLLLSAIMITAIAFLLHFIVGALSLSEIGHVFTLGVYTTTRVLVLIVISSLIWVPIGVWIGRRPRMASVAQPIAQFLAAFPANLLFPLVVLLIVKYSLNVEIWTTPLMILGSQWYILFNVVAGTTALPKEMYLAADNFGVKGWLWWKRVALPGIFPYFVTGAITAAGGAWNASIVAEVVSWGSTTLYATGLGAYITEYTTAGDFPRIALGITVMCIYVLVLNRILWRPLYRFAEERYQLS